LHYLITLVEVAEDDHLLAEGLFGGADALVEFLLGGGAVGLGQDLLPGYGQGQGISLGGAGAVTRCHGRGVEQPGAVGKLRCAGGTGGLTGGDELEGVIDRRIGDSDLGCGHGGCSRCFLLWVKGRGTLIRGWGISGWGWGCG